MLRGTVAVLVDGEWRPVASCHVDERDGGVFVHEEVKPDYKGNVTWRRIGTLELPDREAAPA